MASDRPHYPPPPPGSRPPRPPQPGPYGGQAASQAGRPSPYWIVSAISFLSSCLIGGVALYFSSQVDSRWNAGDPEGARKASQTALIVGIVGIAIGVLFFLAIVGSSDTSSGY